MPPVVKSTIVGKNQPNLFSFFKKPDNASTSTPSSSAANPLSTAGVAAVTPKANKQDPEKSSTSLEKNAPKVNLSTPKAATSTPPPPQVTPKATEKPKAIVPPPEDNLLDSDEEEFPSASKKRRLQRAAQPASNEKPAAVKQSKESSASKTSTKKSKLDESEDEWMDSEEDGDEGSASEASDVNDDEEDSFIVDDEDSVPAKKRKAAPTATKAPTTTAGKGGGRAMKATSTPTYKLIAEPTSTSNITPRTPGSATSGKSSLSFLQKTLTGENDEDGEEMTSGTPGNTFVLPEGVVGQGSHDHNSFDFLKPEHIRDANGNRPDSSNYNPRTLKVPAKFLAEQTPAMAQWWQFKSVNMDTILFFKVGKFYELFHFDADVGFSELDLIYMKGTKAHSGFPEVSYGKFASALVAKGYRVARVEQTETPEMLKERNDSAGKGKKDKVVMRELCSIMTKGTRTYCHLDDLSLLENSAMGISSSLLICIKEQECVNEDVVAQMIADEDGSDATTAAGVTPSVISNGMIQATEYGICCIDTVIGTVTLAQFQDDLQRTRLRAFLARYVPTEVLLEYQKHSAKTLGIVKLLAPQAAIEFLRVNEFPSSASETIHHLNRGQYFGAMKKAASKASEINYEDIQTIVEDWPKLLQVVAYGLQDASSELVLQSIGGALWQLKRSLIDYEVLSLQQFLAYIPSDEESPEPDHFDEINTAMEVVEDTAVKVKEEPTNPLLHLMQTHHVSNTTIAATLPSASISDTVSGSSATANAIVNATSNKHMILDEVALSNLEIFVNNYDRTEHGSMWAFINRCHTMGGKRILRQWISAPLFDMNEITIRQQAVEELLSSDNISIVTEKSKKHLSSLPDIERLLLRIHSNGIKHARGGGGSNTTSEVKTEVTIDHPNTRAIMFEPNIYNIRKIKDFVDLLHGFEAMTQFITSIQTLSLTSPLLQHILYPSAPTKDSKTSKKGLFPLQEIISLLSYFRSIFNEAQAKKDGNIKPHPGVNPDYDTNTTLLTQLQGEFQDYLQDMKKLTGIRELAYFGSGKDRYQLEVPISALNKVPTSWYSKSNKKTHRRYWTKEIETKFAQLTQTEDNIAVAQKDTLRAIFAKFDETYALWQRGNQCISYFDALLSLVHVSSLPNYSWPQFQAKQAESGPVLQIVNGRHPMLEYTLLQRGDGQYIPNDVQLGGKYTAPELTQSTAPAMDCIPKLLLLTGPNMGGKSTLLRQTCLIVILAQLGCRVPAEECILSPVDRIFTRVGASDRILAGQSTFFVELAETSLILKAATEDSLCILDELGRGTATFDGTAIAHAVVNHLVTHMGCRTLFATHYHLLIEDWELDPRVQLGHMDCLVNNVPLTLEPSSSSPSAGKKSTDVDDTVVEEVTFLYKLCHGSSPKSYGINVAKLAGMPLELIQIAIQQSHAFEQSSKQSRNTSDTKETRITSQETHEWHQKIARILRMYERVASIVHAPILNKSHGKLEEFVYLIQEIWRRYDVQCSH